MALEVTQSPDFLFDIVLNFIAANAENIENLNGFPSDIGKKIFMRFISRSSSAVHCSDQQVNVIKMFMNAYDELILNKLNLSSNLLLINEYLGSIIELNRFVTELCLCHCYLGDCHEIIGYISSFLCLKKLCLKNNSLKDDALRKITLPMRMYDKGPKNITSLDLTGNKLTDNSVRWLSTFQNLKLLILTGCEISNKGIQELEQKCHLERCFEYTSFCPVTTIGWAKGLFELWSSVCSQRRKNKEMRQSRSYFSEKRYIVACRSLNCQSSSPVSSVPLVFIKSHVTRAHQSSSSNKLGALAPRRLPYDEESAMKDLFSHYL